MGKLKKYLLAFLLALASVELAYAAATKFTNVEVTGTLLVDGASTLTGATTQTGNQTVTGNLTVNGAGGITAAKSVNASTATFTNSTMAVTVASSTLSADKLCIGASFAALPTTGFNRGCLIVDTADGKLYISTETVVGTQSWKSVGSQ